MKRIPFVKLKTLVKSRFWITRKKSLAYFQGKSAFGKRKGKFYFGKFKRFFRVSRFFRNIKIIAAANPIKRAKISSLARVLYANKFSRKF
jgi:hypothetical protein